MDLARCIGISIALVRRCVSGRSPGDRSVQFVTTNGATIPALGFGTYGMPRSDMLRMIPAAHLGCETTFAPSIDPKAL